MFGVSAAVTTPFKADLSVDQERLEAHIRTLLLDGCTSVTLFGTTGEGASVSVPARHKVLAELIRARIDPTRIILCLHGNAADDIVMQIQAADGLGARRFLLPPPNYYDAPTDDGLFQWLTGIFARLSGSDFDFILYHIPQVVGVGYSVELVAHLKSAFPDLVTGVKDSSGIFRNIEKLLTLDGLEILVGDERLLASAARLGASGTISGIANVLPRRLARVLESRVEDTAISTLVDRILEYPVTPAVKALVAHKYRDSAWRRTAPPLEAISDLDYRALSPFFDELGGSVNDLKEKTG